MRASIHYQSGATQRARELMQEVLDHFDEVLRYPQMNAAIVLTVMTGVLLAHGDVQYTLSLTEKALEKLQATQATLFLPDLLLLKGRCLFQLGEAESAQAVLDNAEKLSEAVQARRSLLWIYVTRVRIEGELNNHGRAVQYQAQAQAIVDYIAEHAGSTELRESFMSTPLVQNLRDKSAIRRES
jgi:tetratricopeptide (TPR) repeat protein